MKHICFNDIVISLKLYTVHAQLLKKTCPWPSVIELLDLITILLDLITHLIYLRLDHWKMFVMSTNQIWKHFKKEGDYIHDLKFLSEVGIFKV